MVLQNMYFGHQKVEQDSEAIKRKIDQFIANLVIEPVNIDPSALPGFADDFERSQLQIEDSSGFTHDADWIEKVCESIAKHQLALVKLPRQYGEMYESLLQPSMFPVEVKDWEVAMELKTKRTMLKQDVLSTELLHLLKGWSTVCEHVCKHVAQKLMRLVRKAHNPLTNSEIASLAGQTPDMAPVAPHELYGQLRIATNCITEPHNDNSYVTMLGTGKMRGTLKLEVEGSESPADWMCAIDFVEQVCPVKSNEPTFLMYAGSKSCDLTGPVYKPKNHIVDFDRTPTTAPGTERINLTYFCRRYCEGYPDATEDITSTELQFQYWNRIIMESELMHRPPRPPTPPPDPSMVVPEISAEEAFLEYGVVDWGEVDLPLT